MKEASDPRRGEIVVKPVFVEDSARLNVIVPFVNTTASTINVAKTKTTCACADIRIDKTVAASGETICATCEFNLRGRRGLQRFYVALEMANGDVWDRVITTEVIRRASWDTDSLSLGTLDPKEPPLVTARYRVNANHREDINTNLQFTSSVPALSIESSRCSIEHRGEIDIWTGTYDVKLRLIDDRISAMEIATVFPQESIADNDHHLVVNWRFRQIFAVSPSSVLITPRAVMAPIDIVISRIDDEPLEVDYATSSHSEAIDITWDKVHKIGNLHLRLKDLPKQRMLTGLVTVYTKDEKKPQIRIPYAYFGDDAETVTSEVSNSEKSRMEKRHGD